MIVRPFIANATYPAGSYVLDPDTDVLFMVVVSPDEPDAEGDVVVDWRTPARDAEHFVIAKDLPPK